MYHFELKPYRKSWNPFQDWEKEVEKMFYSDNSFVPACEIFEGDKAFGITLDVPGMKKEDLNLEVKDNQLYITGERSDGTKSEKGTILKSERRYGKFSRVFTLPQNVNSDSIQARFENGVLELIIPKEEKTQPKKIQISDWNKQDASSSLNS